MVGLAAAAAAAARAARSLALVVSAVSEATLPASSTGALVGVATFREGAAGDLPPPDRLERRSGREPDRRGVLGLVIERFALLREPLDRRLQVGDVVEQRRKSVRPFCRRRRLSDDVGGGLHAPLRRAAGERRLRGGRRRVADRACSRCGRRPVRVAGWHERLVGINYRA